MKYGEERVNESGRIYGVRERERERGGVRVAASIHRHPFWRG